MSNVAVSEPQVSSSTTRQFRTVVPRYEIFNRENCYEVRAALPGVSGDGLSIELENRTLTVKGKAADFTPEGFETLYSEFAPVNYEAIFNVPANVNGDAISAKLENGFLSMELPHQARERKAIKVD